MDIGRPLRVKSLGESLNFPVALMSKGRNFISSLTLASVLPEVCVIGTSILKACKILCIGASSFDVAFKSTTIPVPFPIRL